MVVQAAKANFSEKLSLSAQMVKQAVLFSEARPRCTKFSANYDTVYTEDAENQL